MSANFGWSLPPGCSHSDIDRACGADYDEYEEREDDDYGPEDYPEDRDDRDDPEGEEDRDDPEGEEDALIDGVGFADPGGRSALRAATRGNPRIYPCPNCKQPNRLTRIDKARGYQCDSCADLLERGGY